MTIQAWQPVEYVEESGFATSITDPSMKWIGLVTDHTSQKGSDSNRYHDTGGSGKTSTWKDNQRYRETLSISTTYAPQDFTFLQYFTGADGSISDRLSTIQVGEAGDGENRLLLGCWGEKWNMTIAEDRVAKVNTKLSAADYNDFTATDYIGNGSHATEDSSAPLSYNDLGSITYGGSNISHYIGSLGLSIKNDFNVFTSPDSSLPTLVDSVMLTDRTIRLSMEIKFADMGFLTMVKNYTAQQFKFTVGPTTFTVDGVTFPQFEYTSSPAELMGQTVKSDPAKDLSYA